MRVKTQGLIDPPQESLQLFYYNTITSIQSDHRSRLREKLAEEIHHTSGINNKKKLLDLSIRPQATGFSISLSHCPLATALIFSSSKFLVGVDVECKERINDKLIERVSRSDEVDRCHKPHLLFCAKEAAWKTLNAHLELPTISHIETAQWQTLEDNWSQFKVKFAGNILDGAGFIFENSTTYLSFYTCASTFI